MAPGLFPFNPPWKEQLEKICFCYEPNIEGHMILWFFSLLKKYESLRRANLPINLEDRCLGGGWTRILFISLVIYQGVWETLSTGQQ